MSERLLPLFQRVHSELSSGFPPGIRAEFFAYSDLKHTIRRRQGRLFVRISDALTDAPPEILHSLAHILLGKILRRKIDPQHNLIYQSFIHSPDFAAEAAHLRATRARPTPDSGPGRYFDLVEILDGLNRQYFQGRLQGIHILWSKERSRRRLGYYRECVHTIVISRALDHPGIPRYVVEYVVYHEMLHADLPTQQQGHRRRVHTPEFYRREQLFDKARQADRHLRRGLPGRTARLRTFLLD